MTRLVIRTVRASVLRTLALVVTIVIAVTSFNVLSATVTGSQLVAKQTLDASFQPTYDILVRPHGTRTSYEDSKGLVRPNFLSGIFGGITREQWTTISGLPGVEVAAPIAMIGQITVNSYVKLNISRLLQGTGPQLFRYRTTSVSMNGLAHTDGYWGYIYVTPNELSNPPELPPWQEEVTPSGEKRKVCAYVSHLDQPGYYGDPFSLRSRFGSSCISPTGDDAVLTVPFTIPALVAAVDPVAEARLTGIDGAITAGRYLRPQEAGWDERGPVRSPIVPVIAPTRSPIDSELRTTIERLEPQTLHQLWKEPDALSTPELLDKAPGATVDTQTISSQSAYYTMLGALDETTRPLLALNLWTNGPVGFSVDEKGILHPKSVVNPSDVWRSNPNSTGFAFVPADANDTAYRTLAARASGNQMIGGRIPTASLAPVGSYDPEQLVSSEQLAAVPMEVYAPPEVEGADDSARAALGHRSLRPNGNPAGYLQQPPAFLTSLEAAEVLLDPRSYAGPTTRAAPISVIRVRVAGVTGSNELSRERVRAVASAIAATTGLDVDITAGSSPSPQLVALPATASGAPDLLVSEGWSKKGTDLVISQAVDRKSLALMVLVLIVCVLAIAGAVAAQIAARSESYAVLMCTGWTRHSIARLVLAEASLVGLVAGVISAVLVPVFAAATGVHVQPWMIVAAIPLAVAVALLAAAIPALRATRTSAMGAIRNSSGLAVRLPRIRRPFGVGVAQIVRHPGRSALSLAVLATAAASVTFILAIQLGFRGQVSGTLLGEAVTMQVKAQDFISVIIMAVLALFAVQDNLYVSISCDKASYASLIACGWTNSAIARMVATQAILIGLAGGGLGAALGVAGLRWFSGASPGSLLAALCAIAGAVVFTAICTIIPIRGATTGSIAQILADDEG